MKTWLDIENRFRSMAPMLRACRLDAQWGAAGEHWHVAGTADPVIRKEFELLCGVAGQFLERVYSSNNREQAALLAISNPKLRWYTLLKQTSQFQQLLYGEQQNADGSSAGFVYSAFLPSIAESCANLCLALQNEHPIVERASKLQWLHDNYVKAIVVGTVLMIIGALLKAAFD